MEIYQYEHPPDPFKIFWVNPDRIQRHTNRKYPSWWPDQDRMKLFGRVAGGDWDKPSDNYPHPPKIVDRIDYQSFKAHFKDRVPWRETEFIATVLKLVNSGESAWGCDTREDVLDRCDEYEKLYRDIQDNGYKSQRELVASNVENKTFEEAIKSEIAVDISRNGELLFVDGSHRLIICKLLGLEMIPVVVYFRHKNWMDYRERFAETNDASNHPDLVDLQ